MTLGLITFEKSLEEFLPTVGIEKRRIGGGLKGQEEADRKQDQRGKPNTHEHIESAKHGHSLSYRGYDIIDDKEQDRHDHRHTQTALTDDAAQGRTNEKEDETGDAERKLLVTLFLVLHDVFRLALLVNLVERGVLLGVACRPDGSIGNGHCN